MTSIPLTTTLHSTFGLGWTVLGAMILIGLAAWSYRWTRPPLPVWGRVSLATLRALALVAVWLLAAGFEVRWVNEVPERPRVAQLLDNSRSMALEDADQDRPDTVRAILGHRAWAQIDSANDLSRWQFSETLQPLSGRRPSLDGPVTDLESALNSFANRPDGAPDAIVLISDGAFNQGGAYTSAARRLGVPVHVVAVGDSLPPRDVVISSVVTPELGYAGEEVPLDVSLRATGFAGETVRLRIIGESGQVLETRDIALDADWTEHTETIGITPPRAGVNSWRVEIAPLPGETDTGNNERRAVLRAADRRRTALVFAPAPHPDAAALARLLEQDRDTDVQVVIGAGRLNRTVRGSFDRIDPASLDAAFIVLDGPWSANALSALETLASADLPAVYLLGDEELPATVLERTTGRIGAPDIWLQPVVAEVRPVAPHPIFTEAGGFFDDAPPPPVPHGPYRPGEGRTLAVIQGRGGDLPSLIVSSDAPRTLALYFDGLAVWDRSRRATDPGGEGMLALLDRTLRWLTGGGEENRITVRPEQELFNAGEEARLIASVLDAGLNPVDDARVTATLRRAGAGSGSADSPSVRDNKGEEVQPPGGDTQRRTIEFQSLGGGRYAARTLPWGEGRYVADVTIETDQETVTRTAEFVVDRFDLEAAERRMRPDRLRAVADATGGEVFFTTASLDSLPALLPRATQWVEQRGAWKPFGLWLTLLLVAGLLGVEWLVRTRTGMA